MLEACERAIACDLKQPQYLSEALSLLALPVIGL